MHGIFTMLILIPTLVFWIPNPKSIFGQIWRKSQSRLFSLKFGKPAHTQYLEDVDSYFDITFEDADSYSEISFLKFQT